MMMRLLAKTVNHFRVSTIRSPDVIVFGKSRLERLFQPFHATKPVNRK